MANRNFGKSLMQKRGRLNALGSLAPEFKFGFKMARAKPGTEVFKLPFIRSKVFIAISLAFFAAFCIPYFAMGSMSSGPYTNSLFDFLFNLFGFFWFMGWTVGVTILGLVFLLLTPGQSNICRD